MAKLVCESIEEVFEAAKEKNVKKLNRKLGKQGGTTEKTDKVAEAIASLRKQIADVKKPGGANSTIEKRAKVAELEAKIAKWEAKKK